jgi:hypothetical protein
MRAMTKNALAAAGICALIAASARAQTIELPGGAGPGRGTHVVYLAGDEEYRSEEALPALAKILAVRHGFPGTVLFSLDPADGTIDPNRADSLAGSEALDRADVIVMSLRHRRWPDVDMKRFEAALHRGVPLVALRTSTHAFQFADGPWRRYNRFGKDVLGEGWVSHWGRHKAEATRGVVEPAAKDLPLLRGVGEVFAETDVYEAYPPADATILLRGQVLQGMTPDAPPADYRKKRAADGIEQGVNDPMMPVAWTRSHVNSAGTTNQIFCTTMGAASDLDNEGLRRLVVNAVFRAAGLPVPDRADVSPVGRYDPSFYGFNAFRKGVKPADLIEVLASPP